jgi:PAS domain S-box-containing protein
MSSKVLLIEDDSDLLETTVEYLNDEGFTAMGAENGAQGIQMALQHVPDIIICDINMPGLSGYEVYNMLHQVNTTAVIPFIFLSAKSTRDDILAGLHLGADDYITKPFEFSDLIEVINRRIDRRKRIANQHDENFKVLFENTRNPAFIINKHNIEYVNKPFTKFLGYGRDEIEGMSISNILHGDSLTAFTCSVEQCKEGLKKTFTIEANVLLKSAETRTLELIGSQILFKNQPSIICTLVPIKEEYEFSKESSNGTDCKISEREKEVLELICQGLTNAEIADKLFLSERTVEGHRARLFAKTGTKNAVALAIWAVKNNYFEVR